jgi:NADH-quinone oxidoreductase subunit B
MGLKDDLVQPGGESGGWPVEETPKSVFTTRLEKMVNWARAGSLWPLPFGTACCAIEFMSVVSAHYDLARFGAEVVRFSPRQSDMMIVAGTVVDKQAPILKLIFEQMCEPKWVISMGVCASSGGFYRAYHVMQGIDELVPVDIYIPGCPPTPEGLIYGIIKLQEKIQRGEPSRFQEIRAERRATEAERHELVGA